MEYVVNVMAKDRVGIVRDVSTVLSDMGANITDASQTVMRGYFTLILAIETKTDYKPSFIQKQLEETGKDNELAISVMYADYQTLPSPKTSEKYNISLSGIDKSGMISSISTFLANNHVNIDDLYAFGHLGKAVIMAQVSITDEFDVDELHAGLDKIGEEMGLTVHMQHENIIKATSQIQPVGEL